MTAEELARLEAKLAEQKRFIEENAEKWANHDGKYDERIKALEAKIVEEQAKVLALEKAAAEKAAFPLSAESKLAQQDAFFKDVIQRKAPAGQSTVDADGGFLIPDVLLPGILTRTQQFGACRPKITVVPVALGDLVKYNKDESDVVVYRPGEGVAPDYTKVGLTQESLELTTVIALAALTTQIDINAPGFSNYVVDKIMKAMRRDEDRLILKGRTAAKGGTDSYDGILYAGNVNDAKIASGNKFTDSTADDFIDMTEAIDDEMLGASEYGMHRTMYNHLRKLKAGTTGEYLFAPIAGGAPATLNGYPITFYNQMPARSATAASTKFAFFGNMREGIKLFERLVIAVAMSDSPLFTSAQRVIRVMGVNGSLVAPMEGQLSTLATNA